MNPTQIFPRTLALYVTRRGIAFVCFVHPRMILDWGTKEMRGKEKHEETLRMAKQVLDQFRPNVLVIENVEDRDTRRAPRIRLLYRAIAQYAEEQQIPTHAYSRPDITGVFAKIGASVKHEINCTIVQILPALAAWQPRKRRAFDPETPAQGIFDAAALGFTYFVQTKRIDIAKAMQEEQIDREA